VPARGDGWIMFPWGAERCLSCSPRARVCVYINYILYLYKLVYTLRRMRTFGVDICLFLLLCAHTYNHYPAILPALCRYTSPSPPRHPAVYTHTRPALLPPRPQPMSRKGAIAVITTLPRVIGTCGISRELPHTCPARPQVN